MLKKLVVQILGLCCGWSMAYGSVPEAQGVPLGFSSWKEQQIVRSQNEVVRITNQLLLSGSGDYQMVNQESSKKVFNPDAESVSQNGARLRLKRAQQSLEIAQELDFDDYLEIHLQKLSEDNEKLKQWIKKLTLDEVAQAFKYLNQHAAITPQAPYSGNHKK